MCECGMFESPVVHVSARVSPKIERFLNTKFDTVTHLRLMWEADEWTRQCYCRGDEIMDCNGGRGDLFFLLKMYKHTLQSSVWVWPGRTWRHAVSTTDIKQ